MADDGSVKFVATVYPVREVSLLGSADFAFWADRLAADHLVPQACEDQARAMINASDAKYLGIRFRELSISIFCQRRDGNQQEAVYLVQAFNSVRWFAWVERSMFSTPYAQEPSPSTPVAGFLAVIYRQFTDLEGGNVSRLAGPGAVKFRRKELVGASLSPARKKRRDQPRQVLFCQTQRSNVVLHVR